MKIRLLVGLAALAAMPSCVKSNTAVLESVDTKIFLQAKATAEPNVGKTFWLARAVLLCEKPMLITATKCEPVETNTRLEVEGIEQGFDEDNGAHRLNGLAFFRIKIGDGRAGYVLTSSFDGAATTIDLEKLAAECKRRGDPRVGMTAKQVRASCWGVPERVDRLETARGVTERYVYGDDRRVLFHNGTVTSVQIKGTLR